MFTLVARAFAAAARRPGLLLLTYFLTLLVALPIAAALSHAVEPALAGPAAPLDNLSAILDFSPRPAQAIGGALAYGLVWVLLWGPTIEAFARRTDRAGFVESAARFWRPMLRLSLVSLAGYGVAFFVLHPILLGWLFHALAGTAGDRLALAIRLVLYAIFGVVLAAISLAIDYARVQTVVADRRGTVDAITSAVLFLRGKTGAALVLAMAAGLGFAGLLVAYWAFDRITHGAPGFVALVMAGQLFIMARLALRIVYIAAEVELVRSST